MKEYILICLLLLTLHQFLHAQTETFYTSYDITGIGGLFLDEGRKIIPLSDSSYVILGAALCYNEIWQNSISCISISKINNKGRVLWAKTYMADSINTFHAGEDGGLILLEDGGFMLVGSNYVIKDKPEIRDEDYFLMRLDGDGKELWFKRYGENNYSERGTAPGAIPLSDGGFMLLGPKGDFFGELSSWDLFLTKFDDLGNIEWERTYGGTAFERSSSLAQDKDGGFIIGGHSRSVPAEPNGDGIIIKTDSLGSVLWQKKYGTHLEDGSISIKPSISQEGYIMLHYLQEKIVVGQESPTTAFLYSLDTEGNVLWRKGFSGQKFKGIHNFIELEDGSVVLVGFDENVPQTGNNLRNSNGWMARVNVNGDLLWERQYYDKIEYEPVMSFRNISKTLDGGLIAVGEIWATDSIYIPESDTTIMYFNRDIWVVKTDLDGCLDPDCGDQEIIYVDIPDFSPSLTFAEVPAFQLFPNPARLFTHVYFPNTQILKGKEAILEVFDLQGKMVFEKELLNGNELSILELKDLQVGVYLVVLKVDGEALEEKRLLVE